MNLDDYRITYNLADWERIALRNGEICAPIGAIRAINALCDEVERLRQRVAELEQGLEVATEIINSRTSELETLERQAAPVLYLCTKCGGANYGCKCESLKDCTEPLYLGAADA